MSFALLDQVALEHDITEHGLKAGDLGTVVHLYPQDAVEVEFMLVSGATRAVLTLRKDEIRKPADGEIFAVRSVTGPTRH